MWATLLFGAPAVAADVDFACSPGNGGFIVGVPPLEVRCVVDPPAGTWDQTEWLFGDGGVEQGDAVTYVYTEPGQYSVSVFLDGFVEDSGLEPANLSFRNDGLVTVCAAPEPAFTFIDKGGRDYQMVNRTDVSTPLCIEEIRWDVYRGNKQQGKPLMTFEGWEPRFELPDDGTYTIALTAGGIGGTSAAVLKLDAEYGLTEEIRTSVAYCATTPASAGWLAVGLGLLALRRRTR